MGALGLILTVVGGLATLVGVIIILIAAFQESVGQGFLSLCIPFYIFYFAFAKYESEQKGLVLTVWLGGIAVQVVGRIMMAVSGAG